MEDKKIAGEVPPSVGEFAVHELARLRARLAKYEDAEGRPMAVGDIAEMLEDLRYEASKSSSVKQRIIFVEAADALESQAREIARLKEAYAAELNHLSERNYNFRMELAALKAQQPSGVVINELMTALECIVHDERVSNEVSQECAAVLIEARRLNSSPVSADLIRFDFVNADGRTDSKMITHDEMRERYSAACKQPASAGEPMGAFKAWGASIGLTTAQLTAGELTAFKAGADWQARAALTASAPSHSEQVRKTWPHYVNSPEQPPTPWVKVDQAMMDGCTYTNTYDHPIKCGVAGGTLCINGKNIDDTVALIPVGATFKAVRKSPHANFLAGFEKPCAAAPAPGNQQGGGQ